MSTYYNAETHNVVSEPSNLTATTGGVVHAASLNDDRRPACRLGAYSGLGRTNRRKTTYKTTTKHVTCKACLKWAAPLMRGDA